MRNITRYTLLIIIAIGLMYSTYAQSIRKPWREMTSAEQTDFVAAVNGLNGSVPQTLASEHSRLAALSPVNEHIHNSNIFLPWHRVFILYLEDKLKEVNPNVSLPYWDWTDDWAPSSPLFADNSSGSTGLFGFDIDGNVWTNPSTNAKYTRNFNTFEPQPTQTQLNNIVDLIVFTTHRSNLETGPHNTGHRFVGGSMATMFSPSDPIFFLHHSMVDKVWNDWVEQQWNGGTLDFSDDSDPQLNMLTFIGYQGSTDAGNVVRVNPNDWIDSRDSKVWYAENGEVSLNNYTVSNTENYRYSNTIIMENDFLTASGTTCNVLSASSILLKPGFNAINGSTFHAQINSNSFNQSTATARLASLSERTNLDHQLQASLKASEVLKYSGRFNVYGIKAKPDISSELHNITVYPNPSVGQLMIQSTAGINSIDIYDILGKKMKISIIKLSKQQYRIRLKTPNKGYYIMQITMDDGSIRNQKFTIE